MLAFIHKHYGEKLSLEDIAAAGSVSKSTCLGIFRKYLKETPVQYLVAWRLKNAGRLLSETDLPVSEISLAVGFPSISYFSEVFRRSYGQTPQDYRKNASVG